jgi:hypothetical protein
MAQDYVISVEPGYVHVLDTPGCVLTYDTLVERWRHAFEVCRQQNVRKILIDGGPPDRRIGVVDLYRLNEEFIKMGIFGYAFAFVLDNHVIDEISHYFETAGFNRSNRTQFFTVKQEALAWLFQDGGGQAKPSGDSPA